MVQHFEEFNVVQHACFRKYQIALFHTTEYCAFSQWIWILNRLLIFAKLDNRKIRYVNTSLGNKFTQYLLVHFKARHQKWDKNPQITNCCKNLAFQMGWPNEYTCKHF